MLQNYGCSSYTHNHLDDLIVFSSSMEDHVQHLRTVLRALTETSLTINEEKSHFFVTRVPLLGMLVQPDGYAPDTHRLTDMMDWERPTTRKKMQSLLGTINFHRRYIPRISELLRPMLEAEGDIFEWTTEMEQAYVLVYRNLVEKVPFLHFPLELVTLELEVDASDTAIGAVLFQRQGKERRFLSFSSRVLRPHERNYTVPKKELLAAVVYVDYYRDYLLGTHFHLWVDNKAIVLALQIEGQDGKRDRTLTGWMTKLAEFSFTVFHLSSEDNLLADTHSRVQRIREAPMYTEQQIQEIIEEAHVVGHFGAQIMYYHITVTMERSGIPKLRERCQEYARKCRVCRLVNTHRVAYSPLREPTAYQPNGRWHIDIMYMPKAKSGERYIVVIVDDFSRYLWLRATKKKTATVVLEMLTDIATAFGFPATLKSDQGTEFDNDLVGGLNQAARTEHQMVLPYNSHANGLVERQIGTIRGAVEKLCRDSTGDVEQWPGFVKLAMLDLNMRVHSGNKAAAFGLMMGRGPFSVSRRGGEVAPEDLHRWRQFWETYQKAVVPHIHRIQRDNRKKMMKTYRKNTTEFVPGEWVMHRLVKARLGEDKMTGPFEVLEKLPSGDYRLQARTSQFNAPTNLLKRTGKREGESLASQHDSDDPVLESLSKIPDGDPEDPQQGAEVVRLAASRRAPQREPKDRARNPPTGEGSRLIPDRPEIQVRQKPEGRTRPHGGTSSRRPDAEVRSERPQQQGAGAQRHLSQVGEQASKNKQGVHLPESRGETQSGRRLRNRRGPSMVAELRRHGML